MSEENTNIEEQEVVNTQEETGVNEAEPQEENLEDDPQNVELEPDTYDLNNPEILARIQETVRDRVLANIQRQQEEQRQLQNMPTQEETQAQQDIQGYTDEGFTESDIASIVRKQLEQYDNYKQQSLYERQQEEQKQYYNTVLSDYDANYLANKIKTLPEEKQALIKLKYYEAINEVESKAQGQVNTQLANQIIAKHQSFVNNYLGQNKVNSKIKTGLDSNASKAQPNKETKPQVTSLSEALKIINQR